MATAAMEMEAFFSATKVKPQSEEELQSVLAELPRRELQALSKTHGVKATLKRESLVEMLVRVLKEKLWPVAEAAEANTEEEKKTAQGDAKEEEGTEVVKEEEAKAEEADSGKAAETTAAAEEDTPQETVAASKAPAAAAKKTRATATAAVGKKAAVPRKVGKASESPKVKTATVKVTAKSVSPSVVLEKLHAKEIAKQPTLQEHDQAKKQRAAGLLTSASKFSVVKKTRSKTKELGDAAAAASTVTDKSVTKTLNFGARTPVKQKPPVSAPAALPTQKETKKGAGYKPYVGKLPAYEGDSLFTPKKAQPRPAPMAVSVMKAARVMTPKKAAPTPTKKAQTPTKKAVQTPTKKPAVPTQARKAVSTATKKTPVLTATKKVAAPAKKAPTSSSSDKENSSPPVSSDNSSDKPKNVLASKNSKPVAGSGATTKKPTTMKARVSVKTASTKAVGQAAKKDERRTKFAQDAKTKATAARRQARSTPSAAPTN